jgi:dienelactone hydrolase
VDTAAVAIALIFAIALGMPSLAAAWTQGEFPSNGKPVEENHCVPSGRGPFPAVILLHGAEPRGAGNRDFEDLCSKLADRGYYAEAVEYYSQTEEASAANVAGLVHNFPTWLDEVHAGVAALKKNPSIASSKIGFMGFSLAIDHIVPVSGATDLDAILTKAGRPHEMKIYPGAEHAFNFPEAMFWYKPAAANDAWNRSISFLDKYLKSDSK